MVVLFKENTLTMNMPEYMRVRMYLYNLVAKSNGKNTQIPSENDLCRLFDVSRITVRSAIQGLVKDRFLIPRQGIGTFVNPEMTGCEIRKTPTIGIIVDDGRNVISHPLDQVVTCGIARCGMQCESLFLPDSDMPGRLVEMVRTGIDAVIWMCPKYGTGIDKYLEALRSAGIPLLTVNIEYSPPDQVDHVNSTPADRGNSMAEYLFARNHQKMLFVHNHPSPSLPTILGPNTTHRFFCARMNALTGTDGQDIGVVSLLELESRLRENPDFIRDISVLYSESEIVPYVMSMLNAEAIKVPDDISYLIYGNSEPYFFHGLRPDYVDNETAMRLAIIEWLELRILRNCHDGRFKRQITMDIVPGETVSVKNRVPKKYAATSA